MPVAANFLLAPIYTSFLQPEQYALIGVSTLFQTFITFFISLSLDGALSRLYFNYYHKKLLLSALMTTLVLTVFVSTAIVALVFAVKGDLIISFFFKNEAFKFSNYGAWTLITTFSNVIYALFITLYRNQERVKRFFWANILFFVIPVAGTLTGLIFLKQGAHGAVVGRAVGSLIVAAGMLIQYFSRTPIVIHKPILKAALKFSLPLIPYQLMFALFSNIDRIILERYFTPHNFGVYNFAAMVSALVLIFLNALTNAFNPRIFKDLAEHKDQDNIFRLNNLMVLGTLVVIACCIAFVVPAMQIFISSSYSSCYPYIGILFLSFIPYIYYLIYSIPLFYHSKTVVFPAISFAALATGVIFNYFLLPYFGIWSVCGSLILIRLVQFFTCFWFCKAYKFRDIKFYPRSANIVTSALVLFGYVVLLTLNQFFLKRSVVVLNFFPLLFVFIVCPFVYRTELKLLMGALSKLKPGR